MHRSRTYRQERRTLQNPLHSEPLKYLLASVAIAGLASGCGKPIPGFAVDLVAVSVTVTVDKQPLEGAIVTFIAQDGPSRSSSAVTYALGNYSMKTPPVGEGVLPGAYAVVISKLVMPDGSQVPEDTPPMDVGAEEQLAEEYSSFATPTLSVLVSKSGGTFPFDLHPVRRL